MIEVIDNKIYAQFADKKEDITDNGCSHRIRLQTDKKAHEREIASLKDKIKAIQAKIKVCTAQDTELAENGFCSIDNKKPIKNALTGVAMSYEFKHQPDCVTLKGGN